MPKREKLKSIFNMLREKGLTKYNTYEEYELANDPTQKKNEELNEFEKDLMIEAINNKTIVEEKKDEFRESLVGQEKKDYDTAFNS
jgi:hypothetical protein